MIVVVESDLERIRFLFCSTAPAWPWGEGAVYKPVWTREVPVPKDGDLTRR